MDIVRTLFVVMLGLPLFLQPFAYGQANGLPLKPTRFIEFTANEGTNISLDVSPDGSTIVFALLGDIYTIPIEGGSARRITSGIAFDSLPRVSSDGRRIAFISDRSGMSNIWTMTADGTAPQMVTKYIDVTDPDAPTMFKQLDWMPDGNGFLASPDSRMSRQVYSFVRYTPEGKKNELLTAEYFGLEKSGALSADGKFLFYGYGDWGGNGSIPPRTVKGRNGEWMVPPPSGLKKLNLQTGHIDDFRTQGPGDALTGVRISPDGKWLAYKAIQIGKGEPLGELRIRSIDSKQSPETDRVLDSSDVIVGEFQYAFTPDSNSIVYTSGGKMRRVDVASGKVADIPFSVNVRAELGPLIPTPRQYFGEALQLKQLHALNSTNEGNSIVFDAIGKIWIQQKNGKPKRLTESTDQREYDPVLSRDGRWVAFVTRSYINGGALWKIPTSGGPAVKLYETDDKMSSMVSTPRWLPNGKGLVFFRRKMSLADELLQSQQLMSVTADGTNPREICEAWDKNEYAQHLSLLTVSEDGTRVYFTERSSKDGRDAALISSIGLNGQDRRTHARIKGFDPVATPSPDGKWLAIQSAFNTYVAPMPEQTDGGEVPLIVLKGSPHSKSARQLSTGGGAHPVWSADGKYLSWSWANQLFKLPREQAVTHTSPLIPKTTTIDLTVPRREPKGRVLLSGARVITMNSSGSPDRSRYSGSPMPTDPKVIEKGDILIENARIKAIGPTGTLKIPGGTDVIDVTGKTIVPGYIATHEHRGYRIGLPLSAEEMPRYAWMLAYGVTSVQDPWYGYVPMYLDEMVAAGELTGPRWVGGLNGTAFDPNPGGGEEISSYEAAEAIIKKHASSGAFLIKEYGSARHRIQRQWLAMAGLKAGLRFTAEPMQYNSQTGVYDGWTGIEHNPPMSIYAAADVRELVKRSGMSVPFMPTGGHFAPWRGSFTLRHRAERNRERERTMTPEAAEKDRSREVDYVEAWDPILAKISKHSLEYVGSYGSELVRAGVALNVGTDNGSPVNFHGNIWRLQMIGLTNAEMLRIMTINGARTLGSDSDVGSIEVGKLADLVVLNSNPLDDITNSIDMKWIVKNGEAYDAQTLDVLWPAPRKFKMFPWLRGTDSAATSLKK